MALKSELKYYATNTQDAIDKFKDTLVSAGWTLHDDLSGGSPYAYVLKSQGEDGTEWPCYLYIRQDNNVIEFYVYADWNNTTHTGTYCFGSGTYSHIDGDAAGQFYIWCSADKDSAIFVSYLTEYDFVVVGLLEPVCEDAFGTLQSAASSGSSVVLTLASGDAAGFIAGKSYQILDGDNRQWVEVSSVNTGANQITIATLSYSFASGAIIGNQPHHWTMTLSDYNYAYKFNYATNGSGNESTYVALNRAIFGVNYINPDNRAHQKYVMWPTLIYDKANEGLGGFFKSGCNHLRTYIAATSEHTVSVGDKDSGTSSGSNTSTTLNDTTKSWTINEWADKILIITGGTGEGQFRKISSNTSTVLTVSSAWDTTPDGTSTYTICDEGWLYFCFNGASATSGAIRVI